MIYDVKDGKPEVGLARTVWTIDNPILDEVILYGKSAETIVAVSSQVQLDLFVKPPEIFYGKLCKHNQIRQYFTAKIIIYLIFRNFFTENIGKFFLVLCEALHASRSF